VLYGLEKKEPQSINDYRYIIDNSNDWIVTYAANRLSLIGDPKTDIPRLTAAKKRSKSGHFDESKIQKAIDSLVLKLEK
jgi:hypothetical protein